jgi:hypothetical protein
MKPYLPLLLTFGLAIALARAHAQDEHPFVMPGTPVKTIPAPSPWLTGAQLLARLEKRDGEAVVYLQGVFDATESGLWCYTDRRHVKLAKPAPEAVRTDAMAYLRRQPRAKLRESAAVLIVEMWQERWPCPPEGCCPGRGY